MKLQGSGAERFAKKPDPNCVGALIFGDDEGVVADTATLLMTAWQKQGPSQVISLDEDEIKRDPSMLYDALEAQSLLGETTLLRIRTKGEKLFAILKDVLALTQESPERLAARFIVLNGSLNTRSKMRTAFEAGANVAALHVFADSDTDMVTLVESTLKKASLEIEAEALSAFVGGLPGHRSLANAEIEKLTLYAHDLERPINRADILSLCETNADESARSAIQYALAGDKDRAQAEIDRVVDAGLSPISLIRMFEMEAARMLSALALGAGSGSNVGMKLKPPVWKNEWPAFAARLRKWPATRLVRLVERLHDLEHLSKQQGGAADPATRQLFVTIYSLAART